MCILLCFGVFCCGLLLFGLLLIVVIDWCVDCCAIGCESRFTRPCGTLLLSIVCSLFIAFVQADARDIKDILAELKLRAVTNAGWERIDKEETARGEKVGKPREKIVSVDEMLHVAGK